MSSDLIVSISCSVYGAICLERPHLHLAEALAAELGLAAQRLLRHERVRPRRARVDLVVHEVEQLEDVHEADRDLLLERVAGLAVEEPDLAGAPRPGAAFSSITNLIGESGFWSTQSSSALSTSSTVAPSTGRRNGRRAAVAVLAEDAACGRPAEVRLEHLADVHPRGTPSGLRTTSTGVPSSRNGMSSSGTIFAITPLLPWRPASLSPSAILRFFAT